MVLYERIENWLYNKENNSKCPQNLDFVGISDAFDVQDPKRRKDRDFIDKRKKCWV